MRFRIRRATQQKTSLLLVRRPAAVAGLVIAVAVGIAVQGHARRPRSHVGEERGEARTPACAHSNAAAAVETPRVMIRVEAAVLRLLPAFVFTTAAVPVGGQRVAMQAATAPRDAGPHRTEPDPPPSAAVAATQPFFAGVMAARPGEPDQHQPAEAVAAVALNHGRGA